MEKHIQILEFNHIINQLNEQAITKQAKEKLEDLTSFLSENELRTALRDTTEARTVLDRLGTPPIPAMEGMDTLLSAAVKGEMLLAEELERIGVSLSAVKRLREFLNRGKSLSVGLVYQAEELDDLEEVREEIFKSVRGGQIDDYASDALRGIRRNLLILNDRIKAKAEGMLKNHKEYYTDAFVVNRNGHICLPVKRECKLKVSGSVIDKSSTGATFFIEPSAIAKLNEERQILKIEEENEERKILYTLTAMIADYHSAFLRNLEVIVKLDFIFAKGKLSAAMKAVAPHIHTERYMRIQNGRHPLLEEEICVPLNFEIGTNAIQSEEVQTEKQKGYQGVIITGPNTGGKTVAIKTIGLLSIMAQCGLHIPCESADICMNSQVLCDIGDGQNITENLSTFSAHVKNILEILRKVNEESLVILDELGSGTDPAEGMGIAIAILEQLKISGCLFVATTHYPEIKVYAEKEEGIINARMAFDRDTLKPLYCLEIGKAGESCALHIAKKLGMPESILERARIEAYGGMRNTVDKHSHAESTMWKKEKETEKSLMEAQQSNALKKEYVPKIQKNKPHKAVSNRAEQFEIGDCVMIYPDRTLGIVARKANAKGELLVQTKKEKRFINHKRLKLHVAALEMYPEDYDFSIIFDTVVNRKARRKMEKGYQEDLEIHSEE